MNIENAELISRSKNYGSTNPLRRLGMGIFFGEVQRMLPKVGLVLDAGCGEGYAINRILTSRPDLKAFGADLWLQALRLVADVCPSMAVCVADVTYLPFDPNSFDLVLSLEVLEHLPDPAQALENFRRISRRYLLVSVPNEPLYRMLRMASGKDLRQWGNYPGHIQHWSVFSFGAFLKRHGWEVLRIISPPPFIWTVALCQIPDGERDDA